MGSRVARPLVDVRSKAKPSNLVALFMDGEAPRFLVGTLCNTSVYSTQDEDVRDPKVWFTPGLTTLLPPGRPPADDAFWLPRTDGWEVNSVSASALCHEFYIGRSDVLDGLRSHPWSAPYAAFLEESYNPFPESPEELAPTDESP